MLTEGKAAVILHFTLDIDAWQHGHPEEARKHLALAYETASQLPFVANNMAMILTVGDKPDLSRALTIIQSALAKFPNNPSFRETRGEILVRSGRSQEAIADLEFALPLLASKRAAHKALAEAYRSLGLRDLALTMSGWPRKPNKERARPLACQKWTDPSLRRTGWFAAQFRNRWGSERTRRATLLRLLRHGALGIKPEGSAISILEFADGIDPPFRH